MCLDRGQLGLYYTRHVGFNPLTENESRIPEDKRWLANEAHTRLAEAEVIVRQRNIKTFTVYGCFHTDKTDFGYFVEPVGGTNPRYIILGDPVARNEGDGTVPEWSAEGSDSCKRKSLQHIDHITMCNNELVVAHIKDILED